ncbi:PREDICTED: arrestin domain-containing protein 17-like [Rhagoletis zephyria]|uniref:arrestin domain-containing protein 17-like n=1 Tax=Rhagoletis zephyria TaxID=28612 RepID=UPI0008115918|nr:PREDICTED: arrestin domain-containing protein 17-like [Rhagoletis zephyria]XP_017487026.1 PREDICTED: arrestin domain-containing protein 17-like [Rhagoletis zephyria]
MVVTCVIEFDNNPFGTYYGGQVITGKVTLQADKQKQVKGVVLKINGCAETRWEESSSKTETDVHGRSSTRKETTYFRGHEDYIKSKTYLLGSDENQSSLIEPGIHTYTFACHLPHNCPSSFEGRYGNIRYLVKVELIRPWKFNQTFTKGFTVLKIMDLNYDSPLLRLPCHTEAQKIFCCGPFKTQPLDVNVSLPQAGYVPGQTMPVSVHISNESNIKIEELKVELVMLVCYYSQTPRTATRSERIVVTKVKGDGVPVHCKKQFNYPLVVPATPPTCFNLCRILQIAYQVEVEAKMKGWHANQVICVPVTIGNVPLMSVIQKQPTACEAFSSNNPDETAAAVAALSTDMVDAEDSKKGMVAVNQLKGEGELEISSAIMTSAPPSPWAADDSIPPPSYEAALHMKPAKIGEGEAHDYGEKEFSPRYPVFNLPNRGAPDVDEVDAVGGAGALATNGVASNSSNTTAQKSTWL